jgi:hypothetical protein
MRTIRGMPIDTCLLYGKRTGLFATARDDLRGVPAEPAAGAVDQWFRRRHILQRRQSGCNLLSRMLSARVTAPSSASGQVHSSAAALSDQAHPGDRTTTAEVERGKT